ncbi:T9SS-dependent choice-of-anchor J family protein [Fulvivirga kasyanovii]|nr:T9SS type A sorting domain-containing protein [Fulvivirga kasyanovii]
MKIRFLCCCFLLISYGAFAQQTYQATYFTTSEYVREIPALSAMDNIIAAQGFEHVAPPKRRGTNIFVPGKGLPKGEDPLIAKQRSVQRSAEETLLAAPIVSFDAHVGSVLNDPTGAIGPNHYVYAFNSGFGILDRSGNVLAPEASLGTLFPGETLGDPVVVYDNFADRFIIMEFSNSPNGILIAVCQGPDPVNDGWYTYRFNTGTFPDYEKLSIWSDGYYITANKDQNSASTSQVIFALERDNMLTGASAQMIGFPLPGITTSGFYSPGGFNATGSTLPPVGVGHSVVYMQDDSWSGVSQDHLKIWTTDVDWSSPSNSTISSPQILNTSAFDGVFDGGSFQNLDEPGSGPDLDALQATMMYMTNYRRFGTHNSVVMNFVVDVSGNDSRAGIRWYELRQTNDGDPWTIYQEGTYLQPDGHSAYCGSIAMDSQGNIGMGYTIVSSTVYTSLRYTGRLATDPLGTMPQGEQVVVNGDSEENRGDGRYGDYAQITVDPLDDLTFWHIGEYFKGNNVRRSHVVAFKLGSGSSDTEPPTAPNNLSASNVTSSSVDLSWNASTDNVGVTGYNIYNGASLVTTVSTTSHTVTGLSANTNYTFTVRARDAAANESGASNSVNITTLPAAGCSGGITSFPYSEGFENTIGAWTQSTSDDLNWTVDANGTPSSSTGPSSAAEGSYYIYVEASGSGYPNKQAIINSPCFDLSSESQASFNFKFHMYGASNMGSIALEASNDNGQSWTSLWSMTGNQGNSWQSASIDLAAYLGGSVQLRFNRITGSTWQADIAIDDVELSIGDTGGDCVSGDVELSITLDNYPQETSWTLKNSSGTTIDSESYSSSTPDGSTVTKTFSGLAADTYTFTINDTYGDGICCGYGNGSYTLSSAQGVIVTGGDFGSSESTEFCVESASAMLRTNTLNGEETDLFQIYPNPTRERLSIAVKDHQIENVQIFSMYGMLVTEINEEGPYEQIDVSHLTPGTYFIRITSGDQKVTRKFIKE